jgi:aminopeptidase YwaD
MATTRIASEHVFMRLARACLGKTERFFQAHPVRSAGYQPCLDAARDLAIEFGNGCDSARTEDFEVHPRVLWYTGRIIALGSLLGAGLSVFLARYYGASLLIYVGLVCCWAACCYGVVVYVCFSSRLDWLLPRGEGGCNVVGELNPAGAPTQQILLVGHHDAAYVFSFLESRAWGWAANLRFFAAILGFVWVLLYSTVLSFGLALGRLQPPSDALLVVTAVACVCAAPLYFMITHTPAPGAGDNLNSPFMALTVARYFAWERRHGHPLQKTKLVVVSMDGEEIGQRGAKAYVQRHLSELNGMPTWVLNMDTVVHPDDLTIATRDRNWLRGLSAEMVADVSAAANWLGIAMTARPFRFGAGGTDAAPFADAGIKATSIVASSMAIVSRGHQYHTSRDRVQAINAAVVRDTMMIAAQYIRSKDA